MNLTNLAFFSTTSYAQSCFFGFVAFSSSIAAIQAMSSLSHTVCQTGSMSLTFERSTQVQSCSECDLLQVDGGGLSEWSNEVKQVLKHQSKEM